MLCYFILCYIILVLLCVLRVSVCFSYPVSEEHQVEFMEKKDHAVVLNALRRFKDTENVVLSALQVLMPLAEPGKTQCILFVLLFQLMFSVTL